MRGARQSVVEAGPTGATASPSRKFIWGGALMAAAALSFVIIMATGSGMAPDDRPVIISSSSGGNSSSRRPLADRIMPTNQPQQVQQTQPPRLDTQPQPQPGNRSAEPGTQSTPEDLRELPPKRNEALSTTQQHSADEPPKAGADPASYLLAPDFLPVAKNFSQIPPFVAPSKADAQRILTKPDSNLWTARHGHFAPIVDETHKILFCTIAKSACTAWRQFFRRLKGFSDWDTSDERITHNYGGKSSGLTYLSSMGTRANALFNDPSYFTAGVVRNPLTRVLSAWKDKFAPGSVHHWGEISWPKFVLYNILPSTWWLGKWSTAQKGRRERERAR